MTGIRIHAHSTRYVHDTAAVKHELTTHHNVLAGKHYMSYTCALEFGYRNSSRLTQHSKARTVTRVAQASTHVLHLYVLGSYTECINLHTAMLSNMPMQNV